jgi:hypothetical protein
MTTRHSYAEVTAKYAPSPDPNWSLDIEAQFFARLDECYPIKVTGPRRPGTVLPLTASKAALLREYATDILSAQRLSSSYLTTLSAVLGCIAIAERRWTECVITQRDDKLGPRQTLRTIQAQLVAAEVLTKETRSQGHGFVGDGFVYRPSGKRVPRRPPAEELEGLYRATEVEADYPLVTANIEAQDVLH